jgi:hypothetical protein
MEVQKGDVGQGDSCFVMRFFGFSVIFKLLFSTPFHPFVLPLEAPIHPFERV